MSVDPKSKSQGTRISGGDSRESEGKFAQIFDRLAKK